MKFHSEPVQEHAEVPLADEGRLEALIDRWTRREAPSEAPQDLTSPNPNACYVVSVEPGKAPSAQLAEMLGLVRAQGDQVVGFERYHLTQPDPRTLLGKGTLEAIAERATAAGADLLVIDAELSPSQMRNMEDATGLSITDREGVILNVFLRNARTRSARIQVEIAQLEYLRPRIRGLGLNMDQQAGGMTKARGPGETISELLARRLDGRLADLRRAEKRLARAGETQRKRREGCAQLVLVGYTNAGKTTLMNALTSSAVSAKDSPFETLDTTSRCLTRHGGDVLLSDTVGFIRRLPERLLASFESTLSQIHEASLLVIVVDASDPEHRLHLQTTEALLERLGAAQRPRYYVFNKLDKLPCAPPRERFAALSLSWPFMCLSGHDEASVQALKEALIRAARGAGALELFVPYEAKALMAKVYARCRVLEARPEASGLRFLLEGPPRLLEALQRDEEVQR